MAFSPRFEQDCACKAIDAYDCYRARHPRSVPVFICDDQTDEWQEREACECDCHDQDEDEWD